MLCDNCFWKFQCYDYDHYLEYGEEINRCSDEYGGICYRPWPNIWDDGEYDNEYKNDLNPKRYDNNL